MKKAYLLYDTKYEIVINDARTILNDYYTYLKFAPAKLDIIDFDITGGIGKPISCSDYLEIRNQTIKSGHGFVQVHKKGYLKGWNKNSPKRMIHVPGYPEE